MTTECSVCRDNFTLRLRKEVRCPHCDFVCCVSCLRRFILTSATEPVCMSCKVQFNYEFVLQNLPTTFWNQEYKEFRKDLLLAREESLLPETQECVVRMKQAENIKTYADNFYKEIRKLLRQHRQMITMWTNMNVLIEQDISGTVVIEDDHPLFRHFDEENKPSVDENNQLVALQQVDLTRETQQREKRVIKSSWVIACPAQNCRGFLRGEQGSCPICQIRVCTACIKSIDTSEDAPQHACTEDDLQTVELLRQNTKSCPNCSMLIYKVSGCDQMWCTQCRTPFSWRTGQRINQTIHNPHYYEWMQQGGQREVGRELMDVPCGGLPPVHQFDNLFKGPSKKWVYSLHRYVNHVEQVLMPRSQRICDAHDVNKRMRVQYLRNSITRDMWKDELYRQEKVRQKHQQYLQILQTFVAVVSDWMRRLVVEYIDKLSPQTSTLPQEEKLMRDFSQYIINQVYKMNTRFRSNLPNPCASYP